MKNLLLKVYALFFFLCIILNNLFCQEQVLIFKQSHSFLPNAITCPLIDDASVQYMPLAIRVNSIDWDHETGVIYVIREYFQETIQSLNTPSDTIEQILIENLEFPEGIRIDQVNKKLYWFEYSINNDPVGGILKRANLDGSEIEIVASGLDYEPPSSHHRIVDVEIIPEESLLFVFGLKENFIQKLNLETGEMSDFLNYSGLRGIEYSYTDDRLYYIATESPFRRMFKVSLDGTKKKEVFFFPPILGNPIRHFTLDENNERFYVCDDFEQIFSISLDGSEIVEGFCDTTFAPTNLKYTFIEYYNPSQTTDTRVLPNEEITIFPNPSQGLLQIQTSPNTIAEHIEIYNVSGQKMSHQSIPNGLSNLEINMSSLPEGIYFLRIRLSINQVIIKKVVLSN